MLGDDEDYSNEFPQTFTVPATPRPSPLLVAGLSAVLLTRDSKALNLAGILAGAWAFLHWRSQDTNGALQELVNVHLGRAPGGCNCK